jgi:hypothetical protein
VFAVVIFGLYDPKTGSKLGLSGPKWGHELACNTLNPKPGSNLGYWPQNGVRIGSFTLKLDLWTAFGYMGFSVYGLFGIGAFGYTGFSVLKPPPMYLSCDTKKLEVQRYQMFFGTF